MDQDAEQPALATRPGRLTGGERRRVAAVAMGPLALAVAILAPVGVATGAPAGDIAGAAVAYGGLLGLAAAFVAVDRLQARQCPRCRRRRAGDETTCRCGYDLRERPRYACARQHAVYLADGHCACGRPLARLPTARRLRAQVLLALRLTAGLLGLLLGLALVVHLLQDRL